MPRHGVTLQGLSTPSGKATVAVAVGVTASGALYLLARNAGGSGKGKAPRAQVLQLTTLAQLQQYAGLRGQLNARLTWLTAARHLTAVCVPNQGAALAAFPSGLCALPQLTQLCLAGSAIAEVPPAIGRLRRLRDLDLSRCRLASVPPELGALRELKYLNLMGNQLEVRREGGLICWQCLSTLWKACSRATAAWEKRCPKSSYPTPAPQPCPAAGAA